MLNLQLDSMTVANVFFGFVIGIATIATLSFTANGGLMVPNNEATSDTPFIPTVPPSSAEVECAECPTCPPDGANTHDDAACNHHPQKQCATCPSVPTTFWTPPYSRVRWSEFLHRDYNVDALQNPRIQQVEGVFSPEECERIVRTAHSELKMMDGVVFKHSSKEKNDEDDGEVDTRRARVAGIPRQDESFAWIYERILAHVNRNNDALWHDIIPRNIHSELVENMQIAEYHADIKGHYDWHQDVGTAGLTARRRLSIVVQLSDPKDYEGGEFEIQATAFPIPMDKKQGSIFIFPAYVLHRVKPVSKGKRNSLALWIQTD